MRRSPLLGLLSTFSSLSPMTSGCVALASWIGARGNCERETETGSCLLGLKRNDSESIFELRHRSVKPLCQSEHSHHGGRLLLPLRAWNCVTACEGFFERVEVPLSRLV